MLTKPPLTVWCDGQHLSSLVSWGDLDYKTAWPGGSYDAALTVTRRSQQRPRILRRGMILEVKLGGFPLYVGTIDKPDWNGREAQIKARGLMFLGDEFHAFDALGATVDNPTTAITAAQTKGMPWLIGNGIPNGNLNAGTTEPVNKIGDLLDAWAEELGQRWEVDPLRYVHMRADPTTVSYVVPAGVVDAGQSSDEYRSRIVLRYKHTGGTFKTAWSPGGLTPPTTADYTPSERIWNYSEWVKDVTSLGAMSDARAIALADKIYELAGGTPGWANGMTVPYGQFLTRGGRPVHPATVKAGRRVRVYGVPNELTGAAHTEFVIGETSYEWGSKSVGVNPVGITVNSAEDAWRTLFEGGDS